MGISVAGAFCYGLLAAWHGSDYRCIVLTILVLSGKSARTTQVNAPPDDERKREIHPNPFQLVGRLWI